MNEDNLFTKKELLIAFEQGSRYDYRITKAPSFNKWYNMTYLKICNSCKFLDQKYYRRCVNCDSCNLFVEINSSQA